MSLPEVLIWQRLKGGQAGMKFRKQHPVGPYVVDFFCREAKLIVEIDGEAHGRADRPARDERRDAFLFENGFKVLHVNAADVLKDADEATAAIVSLVASPLHHPSDDDRVKLPPAISATSGGRGDPIIPPRAGEDF